MKKLAVIGQYGTGPKYLTGQAVKTVFITDWMKRRYGEDQIEIVNTYGWKKHPVRLALLAAGKAVNRDHNPFRICRNLLNTWNDIPVRLSDFDLLLAEDPAQLEEAIDLLQSVVNVQDFSVLYSSDGLMEKAFSFLEESLVE